MGDQHHRAFGGFGDHLLHQIRLLEQAVTVRARFVRQSETEEVQCHPRSTHEVGYHVPVVE